MTRCKAVLVTSSLYFKPTYHSVSSAWWDGTLPAVLDNALLPGVGHVVLVLSGKGGVGKSTIATQLATALAAKGKKVGLLDIDLCGPSVPAMLNMDKKDVYQCDGGWVPVFADKEQKLSVMSIAFLLENKSDPVVWRGPKKNTMIKQFLSDVVWGEQDYLIIDTPPGTSDEHISVVESLQQCSPDGAVLVTTPQGVSVADVRRELTFCRKLNLPVLGIVENMSGFVCPCCSECTNIFSVGGGKALAEMSNVPFLGSVPLDPQLAECLEKGDNFMKDFQTSPAWEALKSIADEILKKTTNEKLP